MKRSYRLGRRGEAAGETRQRILDATFELHAEQGIAATTMKQIAERADVSVGTVYHHFPTYEDAIQSCGRQTWERFPPPGPAMLDGVGDRAQRVQRLVREVFAWYGRLPAFERVRCDRDRFAPIAEFVRAEARNRLLLAAATLGEAEHSPTVATVAAVLDVAVFRALCETGLDPDQATAQVASMLTAWLLPPTS